MKGITILTIILTTRCIFSEVTSPLPPTIYDDQNIFNKISSPIWIHWEESTYANRRVSIVTENKIYISRPRVHINAGDPTVVTNFAKIEFWVIELEKIRATTVTVIDLEKMTLAVAGYGGIVSVIDPVMDLDSCQETGCYFAVNQFKISEASIDSGQSKYFTKVEALETDHKQYVYAATANSEIFILDFVNLI